MKGIMVMGTASDVGKSLVCTAFCRLLAEEGIRTAPFKSQNLSPYSVPASDGIPISRAQAIQAEAARTEAVSAMNPIILQPGPDGILTGTFCGRPLMPTDGLAYREQYFEEALRTIRSSLDTLAAAYDALVIEGAGSPVEMNLRDRDITNMRIAEMADVPVILVADIDRGGVFASIAGTLALLRPNERARVKAIVINQFKGDPASFRDGVEWLESYTGIPVAGIIPHLPAHGIAEEDADREIAAYTAGGDKYDGWAAHVRKAVDWPFIRSLIDGGEGRP
ncbi:MULTISPECIES: cobyric acid synthase [Sporosarcina]|uniref:cobyric acid synthase n=1 Tax=Sporosarcina TaxID=1569 RepID=UPI0006947DBF|nr:MULTISPECIES: cobyric acid synthase [Sporosarcina]WJY26546.1 cobyric acid synthase [Sporosarcina sp. 0.2-SM1T-5]